MVGRPDRVHRQWCDLRRPGRAWFALLPLVAACGVQVTAHYDAGPACDVLANYFEGIRNSRGLEEDFESNRRLAESFLEQAEQSDDMALITVAEDVYEADAHAGRLTREFGYGNIAAWSPKEREESDRAIAVLRDAQVAAAALCAERAKGG